MAALARNDRLLRRGTTYYYHRRVPTDLVARIGKPVIKQSLKTGDLKEARRARSVLDVRWDAEFERLQGPLSGDSDDLPSFDPKAFDEDVIVDRIREYVSNRSSVFEKRQLSDPVEDTETRNDAIYDRQRELRLLSADDDPEGVELLSRAVPRMTSLPSGVGAQHPKLVEVVRRAMIELARREIAYLEHDFSEQRYDALFKGEAGPTATFSNVVSDYLEFEARKAQLNKRRSAWIETVRSHTDLLIEFFGGDTDIACIGYEQVQRFVISIAAMPTNRKKIYGTLPLTEVLARAEAAGCPTLSAASQRRYIDILKGILQLAANKRLIPNNPAEGISPLVIDSRSEADRRPPFKPEQIAEFFASDFYRQWVPGSDQTYRKSDRDWRYWLPFFAAYMGMRPNEICQLRVSDFATTANGVLFLTVTDKSEDGEESRRVKTRYSRRRIPVHPVLIEVGLQHFLKTRARSGPNADLFENMNAARNGYRSQYALKRFRDVFLPDAIKLLPGQVFYSFRHSFRDALRRIDAPSDVLAALGGWTEGNKVSDNYGDRGDPDYLYRWVKNISYGDKVPECRYQ